MAASSTSSSSSNSGSSDVGPSPEGYKPLWLAKYIVHHPKKMLLAILSFILLLTFIAFSMSFKNDTSGESFRVRNHITALQFHGVAAGMRDTQFAQPVAAAVTQQSRPKYAVTFVYRTKDDSNLFTDENVKIIRDFEESVTQVQDLEKYCLARQVAGNTTCWPIDSVSSLLHTANGQALPLQPTLLDIANNNPVAVDKYFDKRFSSTNLESIITRSFMTFGLPLEGYTSVDDREGEQVGKVESFLRNQFYNSIKDKDQGNVQVLFVGSIVTEAAFDDIILRDSLLAIGALLFVYIVVFIHTRSFFLTSLGMLHVLLAFPVAYFFYRVVLQLKAFNVLNFLGIFVILGIGADDIFIFVDAWKQSLYEAPQLCASGLINRMSYTYRRAAKAMLITSLTTAIAFLANVISSIPPIRFFGAFMCFLVLMNFILVITWFPCVVILWHYGTTYGWFQCWKTRTADAEPDIRYFEKAGLGHHAHAASHAKNGREMSKIHPSDSASSSEKAATSAYDQSTVSTRKQSYSSEDDGGRDIESGASYTAEEEEGGAVPVGDGDHRWLEVFFRDKYSAFILKGRYFILAFFFVLVFAACFGAAALKPAEEPARFLRDDHEIQRALDGLEREFKTGELTVIDSLVWGMGPVDRSGTDITDATDIGNPTWQEDFPSKLRLTTSQEFFLETCTELRLAASQGSDYKHGDLGIRLDVSDNTPEIECFMENLRDYRVNVARQSFPIPEASFDAALKEYRDWAIVNRPRISAAANVFETTNVAEEGEFSGVRFDKETDELRFVHIYANLSVPIQLPGSKTRPFYNAWESFINDRNANPKSPSNGYSASSKWVQMETEDVLVSSALIGAGLSIALGFIVITLSTMNILIGAYSILSIICILILVAATIVILGWELGIIESVCMTVVVGLSIDYVVHFANAYIEAHVDDRVGRLKSALTTLGISVFGAAVTTIGSAIILFFTIVLFFVKFGQFIAISLAWSLIVAFLMFFALLAVGGPNGNTGSLWPIWYKIKGVFKKE